MYKLRIYKKDLEYSYALGVFPVLELLKHAADLADQVIVATDRFNDADVVSIREICANKKIPVIVNDHKIKLLAPKENTYVVGVFRKPAVKLDTERPHVVLVWPTNLGNLGMILRTMLVFGFYDLAIVKPAVDAFDPKVTASSVGAVFQMRTQYFSSLAEYVSQNVDHQVYTFVVSDGEDIRKVDFGAFKNDKTFSLVFGNEANGLSANDSKLGKPLTIPQTGDIDSLNLANAVTVALWEVARSR